MRFGSLWHFREGADARNAEWRQWHTNTLSINVNAGFPWNAKIVPKSMARIAYTALQKLGLNVSQREEKHAKPFKLIQNAFFSLFPWFGRYARLLSASTSAPEISGEETRKTGKRRKNN